MAGQLAFDPDARGQVSDYGAGHGYGAGLEYGGPSDEIHLLDYVRVLYKRRWTALTAFVVLFLTVAVYTFTATPIYQATTQLLIEPENPNVVSFKEVINLDRAAADYYQTQYRILQSRGLARRTIDSLKLWDHPEFGGGKDEETFSLRRAVAGAIQWVASPVVGLFGGSSKTESARTAETAQQSRVIDGFLDHLAVSPIRNSRLVDVTFESADPELAASAANALAKAYVEQNLEFKFLTTKEASDWLGERLAEQRKKVEASELVLQSYREQQDAVALEDRQNIVVQKLTDLNAAVTRARTDRIEKEALYSQLRAIQIDRAALDTFPAILSNSFIQQLKGQLADLQRQQAQTGERLGEKHPDMIKLRSAIQAAEAKLQGEVGKVVQSVRNEFLASQAQERSLAAALEQQKVEALALNRKGVEYSVLRREAESNRQIYESLLQRAKETGVSGELKTSNIRIVDAAEAPRSPSKPRKSLNLLFALLGGGPLAVSLAFFFEYLDNRIKSPEEIKTHLGLPFLGLVPALSSDQFHGTQPLLTDGVPAQFSEALRVIRTNLLFSSAEEGTKSIVVTSTGPGEGKTIVVSNLAVAMAQTGQQVLLIDADLRRPRLHQVFHVKQEPGLSNLLVGNAKPSETLRKTSVPGLWLMPSGALPPNPAELLGSERFKELLAFLGVGKNFRWILLDSPPVMAVTDASVLGHRASGVLFVIGADMTSRPAVEAAIEQLGVSHARLTGALLNRVDLERNSYYYARYSHRECSRYYERTGKC